MSTIRICPSILAADLLTLREQVQAAEHGTDRFQVDVMDGMFVPNISFGFPLVEAMRRSRELKRASRASSGASSAATSPSQNFSSEERWSAMSRASAVCRM